MGRWDNQACRPSLWPKNTLPLHSGQSRTPNSTLHFVLCLQALVASITHTYAWHTSHEPSHTRAFLCELVYTLPLMAPLLIAHFSAYMWVHPIHLDPSPGAQLMSSYTVSVPTECIRWLLEVRGHSSAQGAP